MAFTFATELYDGVVLINPATGEPYLAGESTRQTTVTTYLVQASFTGGNVGNTITNTTIIDMSTNPPSTVASIWRNQSLSSDLGGPPPQGSLSLVSSSALTNAELRSGAIDVNLTGGGYATAVNQAVTIGYLDVIKDRLSRFSSYKISDTDTSDFNTTYILKVDSESSGWLVTKFTDSPTGTSVRYASSLNNPGVQVSAAWTNRITLNFGSINQV